MTTFRSIFDVRRFLSLIFWALVVLIAYGCLVVVGARQVERGYARQRAQVVQGELRR